MTYSILKKADEIPLRKLPNATGIPTKDYGLSTDIAEFGQNRIMPWLAKQAQSDTWQGKALRGLGWIGEQHSKIPGYDWLEGRLAQAGGGVAGAFGIDPRLGMLVGTVLMPDATDFLPGLGALGLGGKATKKASKFTPNTRIGVGLGPQGYGLARGMGVSGLGDDVAMSAMDDIVIQAQRAQAAAENMHKSSGRLLEPVRRIFEGDLKRTGTKTQPIGTETLATGARRTAEEANIYPQWYNHFYDYDFTPHHILDNELFGHALNRVDGQEIHDLLYKKHGIRPGNYEDNLIGVLHQRQGRYRARLEKEILKQRPDLLEMKPKDLKRWMDDMRKSDTPGTRTVGGVKVSGEYVDFPGSYIAPKQKGGFNLWDESGTPQEIWESWTGRWKRENIDLSKMEFEADDIIMGIDHMSIIHPLYDMIPEVQNIQRMLDSTDDAIPEWLFVPKEEAVSRLARVAEIQEQIVVRASMDRLVKIQNRIRDINKTAKVKIDVNDPFAVAAWVRKNPHLAATAAWKNNPSSPADLEKLYQKYTKPIFGSEGADVPWEFLGEIFGVQMGKRRYRLTPPRTHYAGKGGAPRGISRIKDTDLKGLDVPAASGGR